MRLFKGDKVYDFMAVRRYWIALSLTLTFGSIFLIFAGKPKLGTDFLGEVPLDMAIRETSDDGRPITVSQPDSPYAQTFREIAARVWEKVSGETETPARRAAPRIVVE